MTGYIKAIVIVTSLVALALPMRAGAGERVLFVGNSFTFGANSAAWKYRAGEVRDLNREGVGGVPALFEIFTRQAGLDYDVSLETAGGRSLAWHLAERRDAIDRHWDHVVLQEYSTLDAGRPGDDRAFLAATRSLTAMFAARNPGVQVRLAATWSRPDLTYRPGSRWSGRPIATMANDVRAAYDRAARSHRSIRGVAPVGQAFTCAIRQGVADADPYDGLDPGKVDLWSEDHYHASVHGYYLKALVLFGQITGRDPRTLGKAEIAAGELGISPDHVAALQAVAATAIETDGECGR
jgi:hypothetical protein